jgi:ATP-dependent DNA helicase RecG
VLLFDADPLTFVTGAFVKLGFFRSESDLAFNDEIAGDLFLQVQQTLDLLFTKYLKAAVTYEGIVRVEHFPVPREALREAVLNALVHRDYAVPAPVQIRVHDDKLVIVNPAVLPEGWTQASLLAPHYSHPFNPDIANAFFRAGEIEAWGRGIQRIFDACRKEGTPRPALRFEANGLWIEFPFAPDYVALIQGAPVKMPVETPAKTPEGILAILARQPHSTLAEVASALGKSTSAVERAARKLREQGRLRYVGPKKGGRWEVTP